MSTPMTRASGSIVTTGVAVSTGPGVMSFARASTDAGARFYDGTSSGGVLLDHVPASDGASYNPPVQFRTGLYAVTESTVGSSAGGSGGACCHFSG